MDMVALVLGFVIGVVLVAVAVELGMKKSNKLSPASKHTKKWDISEITNPKIMAEYLVDVDLPKNSRIIVNQCKDKGILQGLNAKKHNGVRGNYIVGDNRALILAGPVKKDEMAFWTVEKEIIEKLNSDFDEMWAKGTTMKPPEEKK